VPDLPAPTVTRLSRARWLDARLLLGVLLVLVSVAVGAKVFAEADERVAVWAVTRDLGADTTLADGDLVSRSVRLDDAARRYVSADQPLDGMVLRRPVGKDELLPVAAVGEAGAVDQRRVVIEVERIAAAGLDKGSVVDVYAVPEAASNAEPPDPELVLTGVTVAEDVNSGGGAFGGTGATAGLTLLVDGPDVPRIIDAVASGTVYVVQVPAGGGPGGTAAAR
jgi:hypothetical protein